MSAETFIKIERDETLSRKVENQIRQAILQKIYLPGDRLPGEFELAEKFGVSRTAVREALHVLAGRGLVEMRKGSGIYIAEIDMSTVVDPFYQLLEDKCGQASLLHIIRVRKVMEPEIVRVAAAQRTLEDLAFLEDNFKHLQENAHDPTQMIEIDIKFHRRIAQASENPIIPIMMEPIFQLLYKFISSTYKQSHAPDLAIYYHEKILESIRRSNSDDAASAMRDHLLHAENHVLQYYESIGFDYHKSN